MTPSDRAGDLWIGTVVSLERLAGSPAAEQGGFQHFRHDPEDAGSLGQHPVQAIREDRAGDLWIGTRGGGLSRWDRATEEFVHYRHDPEDPESLIDDFVFSIHEDKAGILWFGTWSGGVDRFNPTRGRFDVYRRDPKDSASLTDDRVMTLCEDRSGDLWVGTFTGLDRWQRSENRFLHYRHDPDDPGSLGHDFVTTLTQTADGSLWVGHMRGLDRLDPIAGGEPAPAGPAQARFVHYRHDPEDPTSLSGNNVAAIVEDGAGTLWVATCGTGLNRLDDHVRARELGPSAGGGFVHYRHDPTDPHSLIDDRMRALHQDRHGNLWLGTGGGLARLDPQRETFVNYRHDPGDPTSLSHDLVMFIHEDRSGVLWIATGGGGLNRFNPSRDIFTRYTEADGLANNSVHAVLEDELGRLWMSTNRGLSRFDPGSERWTSYGALDGLPGYEFSHTAGQRVAGGRFYFGSAYGLVAFDPRSFLGNTYVPPIVLTSFELFGSATPFERAASHLADLTLGHRENDFGFEYAALSFDRPDKNRYAYRLESFDDDWIAAGSRRYANYTNLPPGAYVLRVKGSNADGVWNEDGLRVRITVRRPPWKTWWAYALYGLTLVAALAVYQTAQRRKLARERAAAEHERRIGARLRRANAAKDELLVERDRLIRKLEMRNAELTRINYTISHDIKNPLVTIKNYAGLLRRAAGSGDTARLASDLGRVELAADQMRELLDELFEYSRLSQEDVSWGPVALDEIVDEVLEFLAGPIRQRRVQVEVTPDLPRIQGQRRRLQEVFKVLVDNAVKFLGDQAAPRIEIGSRLENGEAVVSVRDNGIGIEPRHQDKVFELFDRLDPKVEGTGVGLALARRIVELHGGRIWVESEGRGRGSAFCVGLPFDKSRAS